MIQNYLLHIDHKMLPRLIRGTQCNSLTLKEKNYLVRLLYSIQDLECEKIEFKSKK